MISKTLVEELRSSAQWLTKESILDILEERILQIEKEQAETNEAQKNKVAQLTDEEVKEAVNLMFTGLH